MLRGYISAERIRFGLDSRRVMPSGRRQSGQRSLLGRGKGRQAEAARRAVVLHAVSSSSDGRPEPLVLPHTRTAAPSLACHTAAWPITQQPGISHGSLANHTAAWYITRQAGQSHWLGARMALVWFQKTGEIRLVVPG